MSDLGFVSTSPNHSKTCEAALPPLPPSEKKRPPRPGFIAQQPLASHVVDNDFGASAEFWLGKELADSHQDLEAFAAAGTWPSDGSGGAGAAPDFATWPAPPPRPRTTGSTGRGRRPGRGRASSKEGRKSPLSKSAGLHDAWEIPRVCPPSGQLGPCSRRVYEVRQQRADEELQYRLHATKKRIRQLESKLSQQLQQRKETQEMEAALHAARRSGRAREEALIKDIAVVRERIEATKKRLVRLTTHNRRNQGPVSVSGIQQLGEQGQHLLQEHPEQQQQPQELMQQSLLQPASMRSESPSASFHSGRCLSKERRPPLPMIRLYNSSRPPSELEYGQSAQVCQTSIYEEDEDYEQEREEGEEGFRLAGRSELERDITVQEPGLGNNDDKRRCQDIDGDEDANPTPSEEDMKSFTSRSPPGWETMNGDQLLALASCLQRVVGSSDPAKQPDRSPEEMPSPRSLVRRLDSLLKSAKAQDDAITARQQERFQRDYEHAAMGLADEESVAAELFQKIYHTRSVRDGIDNTNKVLEHVLEQLEDGCTEDFLVSLPPSVGHEESAISMSSAASSANAARKTPRAAVGLRARPAPLLTSGAGDGTSSASHFVEAPLSPVSPSGSPDSKVPSSATGGAGKRPAITPKSWLDYKDFRKAYAIEWHRQLFDQYKEIRSLNSKIAKFRDPDVDREVAEVESQLHHHHHGLRKLCLAALSELEKWESWSARVPIALPSPLAAISEFSPSDGLLAAGEPWDDEQGSRGGCHAEGRGRSTPVDGSSLVLGPEEAARNIEVKRAWGVDENRTATIEPNQNGDVTEGEMVEVGLQEERGLQDQEGLQPAVIEEEEDGLEAEECFDDAAAAELSQSPLPERAEEAEAAAGDTPAQAQAEEVEGAEGAEGEANEEEAESDTGKGATLTAWNNKSLPNLGLVVSPSLEIFLRGPSAFNSESSPPASEVPRSRQSSLGSPIPALLRSGSGGGSGSGTAAASAAAASAAATTLASRIPEEGSLADAVNQPVESGAAEEMAHSENADYLGDDDNKDKALEDFQGSRELGLNQIEEELEEERDEGETKAGEKSHEQDEEELPIPELLEVDAGRVPLLDDQPEVVPDGGDITSEMDEVPGQCNEGEFEDERGEREDLLEMEDRSDHFMTHLRADGSRCLWAMSAIFLAMLQQSQDLAQYG
mmetsp:Transcript_18619/g.39900  ORF Transcript_18619/g.39900 Transcript_18619/m.39900 type:complete len:1175 (+) Transcript_18619:166-3690(+)